MYGKKLLRLHPYYNCCFCAQWAYHPGLSEIRAPNGSQEVVGHTLKWPVLLVGPLVNIIENLYPLFATSHPGTHRMQEFLIAQGDIIHRFTF